MPSSNLRFLSQGVAAATQNRHLPFTLGARPVSAVVKDAGWPAGRGGTPDVDVACALVRGPVVRPSAAAAPMDSKKVRRVVRIAVYHLKLEGIWRNSNA